MVVLAGKIRDVPLQVLRADLVEGAIMRPFQHRPEGLHPVRVRLPAYILAGGVDDGLVGSDSV